MVEFSGEKINAVNDNFELRVGDFVTSSNPSWQRWFEKHFGKNVRLRIANITGTNVTVVAARDYKPGMEIPVDMKDPRFNDFNNLTRDTLQFWEIRKLPAQIMDSDEPNK